MSHAQIELEPAKAAIRQTFDTVASVYGLGSSRFFHLSGEIMADLLALSGHERVLDAASGTGATALPLARRLPQGKVLAVDISSSMLEQAHQCAAQENLSNIEFLVRDITQLPFAAHTFDHATCAFGLFFVEDMPGLLKHIADKVKPNGKIIISGFCGDSFQPMANLFLNRVRDYGVEVPEVIGWQRMSQPEQLQAIFNQTGLVNMQIERRSLGYYIDTNGWWDIVINAGFRGFLTQLGDRLPQFEQEHLREIQALEDDNGLWLEIDVNYTWGIKI